MESVQVPMGTLMLLYYCPLCYMRLKHYITVCKDYAKMFNILFNPIKLKLICFNVKHKDFALYLCNQPVTLVEDEIYLEMILYLTFLIEAFHILCKLFI